MTAARQALTVSVDPALVLAGPPQRLLDAWSAAAATAIAGWRHRGFAGEIAGAVISKGQNQPTHAKMAP
jgi:hypothetical protein